MVNASEWLNQKIPKDQRAQATQLRIYRQCQSGHTKYYNGCNYCNNRNQNPHSGPPSYQFYNTILEGDLDLGDFVNLQQLYIYGVGQGRNQQQILNLNIDKCNSLTRLEIHNTQSVNIIRNTQGLSDLKLAIEETNLEYQIAVTKSKLNEDHQLWLDLLLDTQQEALQNDSTFSRKQLEKVKNKLSNVLTTEEIQGLLRKKLEINELE
ncbi:230_t:CDS:2 [Dentiscutata heterogama]|uniref:230_t:CDS:1 n=1 Tax=Dentiscutata heterogama TaxID=1316150 RepID=A0ACA9L9B6_9GLOM|nr:230_t:CDS:2 [Dentiscutata heterogama]